MLKTPERRRDGVFSVNFEHISTPFCSDSIVEVFLLLTFNM